MVIVPAFAVHSTSVSYGWSCTSGVAAVVFSKHMLRWPSTAGVGNKPSAASWSKVYCLPLDYMEVAAAAMAASAYFMALLYIEHWAEEQYGALQLVNATGQPTTALATAAAGSNAGGSLVAQLQHWRSQQQQVNPPGSTLTGQSPGQQQDVLERLLLDFYAHVNEPDGLYAVAAAFGGRSSRLQLAKHEGQWSTVVSSQDQVLQAARSAAAGTAAAAGAGDVEGSATGEQAACITPAAAAASELLQ